jgi:hypothetical protein
MPEVQYNNELYKNDRYIQLLRRQEGKAVNLEREEILENIQNALMKPSLNEEEERKLSEKITQESFQRREDAKKKQAEKALMQIDWKISALGERYLNKRKKYLRKYFEVDLANNSFEYEISEQNLNILFLIDYLLSEEEQDFALVLMKDIATMQIMKPLQVSKDLNFREYVYLQESYLTQAISSYKFGEAMSGYDEAAWRNSENNKILLQSFKGLKDRLESLVSKHGDFIFSRFESLEGINFDT